MNITFNIYYKSENSNSKKFVEEMIKTGIVDKIRSKKGNLRYEYFIALADPETILLIDSWRDQDALDSHHTSEMMGKITFLREKYDLHMRVERFMSDDNGVPVSDRKFIKEQTKYSPQLDYSAFTKYKYYVT